MFLIELPSLHNDMISWHCGLHKQHSPYPQALLLAGISMGEEDEGDGKVRSRPLMYEI